MRAALLIATLCLLTALAIVPAAQAQPSLPSSGYVDRSDPTDPQIHEGCGNIGCIINLEVGLRCFG